jgi:predicted dehydrogenase
MIGYPIRFNSTFRALRAKIVDGRLGDVADAHAVNVASGPFSTRGEDFAPAPVPDWWFNRELTGGGALIDLGIHMINLLRWYFGEVTDIRCTLGHRFNFDFEDSANCWVKLRTGTLAAVSVGWFSQNHVLKVELFGTAGHEVAQDLTSNPILNAARMFATGTSRLSMPYLTELQYFADCVNNDVSPSPSGRDGLRDLEAIGQAYRNATSIL